MKLSSIHHIAIIVSDIEKAREFYVQKLGFEVIREITGQSVVTGSWIFE